MPERRRQAGKAGAPQAPAAGPGSGWDLRPESAALSCGLSQPRPWTAGGRDAPGKLIKRLPRAQRGGGAHARGVIGGRRCHRGRGDRPIPEQRLRAAVAFRGHDQHPLPGGGGTCRTGGRAPLALPPRG